jgi:signal transduction histidine kinase
VRNTDRITRMIEQLLDFTRIRNGELPTHRGPSIRGALSRNVVSELPPRSQAGRRSGPRHPVGLFDADRIWQALSNLLANAIDHGAPGGRVRILVDGADPDK